MYIITLTPTTKENLYLYHTGDFGPVREMAHQFNAEEAIEKQNVFAGKGPHYRVAIQRLGGNLGEQLSMRQLETLAALIGAEKTGRTFIHYLRKTPPLSEPFNTRLAAIAYLDTARKAMAECDPEVRT